ncbi:MAG: 4Fe-4S dicluster domain-containing protein [Acidaminobacter sp.]|uniref:ATP-binding protein n=1 Tax=Acidaminobacter sp. TaxID=1872102 RepID=UPI001384B4FD|nr:4Fe-4S dicluster domain-containing protein [Acidaminobacter sp.]MZQ96734.1 4Fe-4S dicluster domain-containing protein [Acidaminobacter sp.]
MKRKIVEINEELCNGCRLCVDACHEGAIELVNGKARLVSDMYCDGLGDCLPACPTGAIEIIEREADEYSQEAVDARLSAAKAPFGFTPPPTGFHSAPKASAVVKAEDDCGCPSSKPMTIERKAMDQVMKPAAPAQTVTEGVRPSELTTWPVQINLVNTRAEFLKNADLLIAADCTAFAYGDFHKDFVKGRVVLIGCPKLDDNQHYINKLAELFTVNDLKSVTVVRMQVPCCSGITHAVKSAMLQSGRIFPYSEVTIKQNGEIL